MKKALPLAIAFFLSITAPRVIGLEILFPLYSYPTWYTPASYIWDDVADAGATVPITAIINPNNGPDGGAPNDDYVHGMSDLAAGGVAMIGYVYTKYGDTAARPLADIKADIDLYDQFYTGVTGIFLDEVSDDPAKVAYYKEIYDYIQDKPNLASVIANPATQIPESYLATPATDTAVIFENASGWSTYTPDAYVAGYPANRFAGLFLNVPTASAMRNAVDLAVARNIGYVFATNDTTPNPFDSLPSYWADEVSYVASIPEPCSAALAALGIGLMALGRKPGITGSARTDAGPIPGNCVSRPRIPSPSGPAEHRSAP